MKLDPQKDWNYYNTYRDDSQDWRQDRDKNEKFYFNHQWGQSQASKMESRGQPDIVINKIRQLIRMRVSMMVANKPMGKVFGVKKGDIQAANQLEKFADWHMYNSEWQVQLEKAVMGQQRVGLHWLTVFDDPIADFARGELKIGNEPYRHVFLDKAANKWDFSDAARIILTKQRRPEDFLNSLPGKIRNTISDDELSELLVPDDEIRWAGAKQGNTLDEFGTPITITPTGEGKDKGDWIREMDIYEKRLVDVPVAIDAQGIIVAMGDPDEGFSEFIEEQIGKEILSEDEVPQYRIAYRKCISGVTHLPLDAADMKKKEDILPISTYPVIPIVDEDTGNALPYGEIDFQAGIQKVYNACISLTLLNASLASNMKMVVDAVKAGHENIDKIKKAWAEPGAVVNMTMDVNGNFPYQIERPEPLTQAWFMLAQSLAAEIEMQSSRGLGLRSGDPVNAPETFSATLQLGQWAQDILRIPLSRLELALERVYNTIFEWSPTYYESDKWYYTLGEDGTPAYELMQFTNLQYLKANYRIRAGSTMPSQTVSELGILQNLAQKQPALIGAVVDRMPGLDDRTKAEIKQSIDLVSQLQNNNSQLQEMMQLLQTQLQHLQEENLALKKEQAMIPIEKTVNKIVAQLEAQQSEYNKRLKTINGRQPKSKRS